MGEASAPRAAQARSAITLAECESQTLTMIVRQKSSWLFMVCSSQGSPPCIRESPILCYVLSVNLTAFCPHHHV